MAASCGQVATHPASGAVGCVSPWPPKQHSITICAGLHTFRLLTEEQPAAAGSARQQQVILNMCPVPARCKDDYLNHRYTSTTTRMHGLTGQHEHLRSALRRCFYFLTASVVNHPLNKHARSSTVRGSSGRCRHRWALRPVLFQASKAAWRRLQKPFHACKTRF